MNESKAIVFDRYTEKNLMGGTIIFDRSDSFRHHLRFNVSAIRMLNIDVKNNVQFIKIGDEWFVCITDLKRGYRLNKDGPFAYRVNAKIFVNGFLEDQGHSAKIVKYKLKATNHELCGYPLFQIHEQKILKA